MNEQTLRRIEDEATRSSLNFNANDHHWMFNDCRTGKRVLDFWPSTGRYWSAVSERNGFVKESTVVMLAAEIRDGLRKDAKEKFEESGRIADLRRFNRILGNARKQRKRNRR